VLGSSVAIVLGAGLPAFVGRYCGSGVLGWDSAGAPIGVVVVVWIAEGRIGVFVDGAGRTFHLVSRFV
jgi:hypothetical protein